MGGHPERGLNLNYRMGWQSTKQQAREIEHVHLREQTITALAVTHG